LKRSITGIANEERNVENNVAARSDPAYRLASISKSITAIAVMQLVERGKIDLNAPISKKGVP